LTANDGQLAQRSLAKFPALHPGAAKQFAMLFLRHPFAPLLDY
jgi:hypothetical protein